MKIRAAGFNRMFFNMWFRIAPIAATKWLNFQFDIAEALDNLDRDESGELSELEFLLAIALLSMLCLISICVIISLR